MHRRQLLIAGGSLMALSACAANAGSALQTLSPDQLAEEARIARAVLPTQTPRAELLQPWTGPYEGVPPWDKVTPAKLRDWLYTDESHAVGWKGPDGKGDGESVGHRSGRRILEIKAKHRAELEPDDYAHMRKVVGYVARHSKQRPDGDITDTPWRYSLMNWGHDPLKTD